MNPLQLLGFIAELEKERRFQAAFYDLNYPRLERYQALMNVLARHELWAVRALIKRNMFALVYGYNPWKEENARHTGS